MTTLTTVDLNGNTLARGYFSGDGSDLANLDGASVASGVVAPARLGTGAPSSANFLRGDGSWAVPSGVGAAPGAFKNLLIGADFSTNPWQLGTTFTGVGAASYSAVRTANRFFSYGSGGANITVSRVSVTDLPGVTAAMRVQRPAGNAATAPLATKQIIESANCIPLQGKAVVLSFWARCGADYSGSGSTIQVVIQTGTGVDEGTLASIVGFTGNDDLINAFPVLSTTWARYAFPTTIATSVREIALQFGTLSAGTAGANDWVDLADIQIESGAAATDFEALPPEIILFRCQRYYQVRTTRVGTSSTYLGWALPASMRVAPTITGGGPGFTVANADPQMVNVYQTTAGIETLVFDAEL